MEWTWEGGKKGFYRVMPNGISARYQGKTYDSMFSEGIHNRCINLGGTAEVSNSFCPMNDRIKAFFSLKN